mgnify:CR=1 FL=1
MSLVRKILLWASTNAWLRERAMRTNFVRVSVRKFMPGEQIEDAIAAAVALKPQGVNAIFTKLGENITQLSEAEDVYQHYLKVLDLIKKAGIDGEISIKPTQLGYDQDVEKCFDYCMKILKACEAQNTLFWIDMEGSVYTQGTIDLFKRLRQHSTKVGIAIQAYMIRTDKDLDDLAALGSTIRMVKGAYLEPATVAYPDKPKVDEQYYKNCVRLLQPDADKPAEAVAAYQRIVELAPTRTLFRRPRHPYTVGLLGSVPKLSQTGQANRERLSEIPGMVPSLKNMPPGCAFHTLAEPEQDVIGALIALEAVTLGLAAADRDLRLQRRDGGGNAARLACAGIRFAVRAGQSR